MISIIVPIYNSSKYIRQCIDSILMQTYKDYELLLIDDGSTDDSANISLEYVKRNNKIKYFYKKNSGVSATRNYGIDKANGRWVMFIDSDDYFIDKDLLQKCVDIVTKDENQMPVFNVRYIYDDLEKDGRRFSVYDNNIQDIMLNILNYRKINNFYGEMFRASWGKMFDLEIIRKENIRFDEKLYIGEDAMFLIDYFNVNNNIILIDEPLYGYRVHNNSACRKYKADLLEQSQRQLDDILEKFDYTKDEKIRKCIISFILSEYWNLTNNAKKGEKEDIYYDSFVWLETNYKYLRNVKLKMKDIGKRSYLYVYVYRINKKIRQMFTKLLLPR